MASKRLTHRDYTTGWVCALPKELAAATVVLDVQHDDLPKRAGDENAYTLGSVGGHNVAIACLPAGDIGNNPAATVATRMTSTFPSIRFWLMVGIGGGVPPKVRLGDVVISTPMYEYPGVVQWDMGMEEDKGFRRIGTLDKAPEVLRSALTKLQAHREIHGSDAGILQILEEVRSRHKSFAARYLRSDHLKDNLYRSDYKHVCPSKGAIKVEDHRTEEEDGDGEDDGEQGETSTCHHCDPTMVIRRQTGKKRIKTHFGVIASGNAVVKSTEERDEINQQRIGGHALCFEMEAAGIASSHPCLVIRGICDYADTHKNYGWQNFAAAVAAASAKELLRFVAPDQVNTMPPAAEMLNELKNVKHAIGFTHETISNIDKGLVLSRLPFVHEATFDSQANESEPYCHQETRIALLYEIKVWAHDSRNKCIFWLNGMAGTGKSTISRTIARDFSACKQLGASFFFKRGEGDRGNASKFFTTIVFQLAQNIPELTPYVKQAMESDPTISTKTMREQFENLIFKPLSKLVIPLEALIVIDALDECEDERHIHLILHLLARIQLLESIKLRLLLTSRPELPIRLGFKKIPESHRDFILHEVPAPVIEHDIRAYLYDQLPEIRRVYNLLPPSGKELQSDWPSERSMQRLVEMAVPLFIFAATLCRFIGDDVDWDPQAKLLEILHYQSTGGLTHLEKTYLPVLVQIIPSDITKSEREDRLKKFRDIIGSIIILFEPLSTSALAPILGISKTLIDNNLHRLHSVLRVPTESDKPVRIFHLSFRDFLVDPERKQNELWVNETQAHRKIGFGCVDLLSKTDYLKENICHLEKDDSRRTDISSALIEKCLPSEVRYACRYWVYHLEKGACNSSVLDPIRTFLEQRLLFWLEALSLIGSIANAVNMIRILQILTKTDENIPLGLLLKDAERFIIKNKILLDTTPMQMYSSAIIFAPEMSIIRRNFQGHVLKLLKRLPRVQPTWDAQLETIVGHAGCVDTVTFSPDGRQLASGSRDHTVKIWTALTGDLEQILEGHFAPIYAVDFSPSGKQIASSSGDTTIKIWDTIIGDIQQSFETREQASSIAFFPDGTQLASGLDDGTIKIWNTSTGILQKTIGLPSPRFDLSEDSLFCDFDYEDQAKGLWESCKSTAEDSFWLHPISVSLDGKHVISGFPRRQTRIWDVKSNKVKHEFASRTDSVTSIAISHDGNIMALGSWQREIDLRDTETYDLRHTLKGHSEQINSLAFRPHCAQLASASADQTIKIWDTNSGNLLRTVRSADEICSISFSPNSRQFVSASSHAKITYWDLEILDQQRAVYDHLTLPNTVIFSTDGRRLTSGSLNPDIFKIWDASIGEVKQILRSSAILNWVFSSDGRYLAAVTYDVSLEMRDPKKGESWEISPKWRSSIDHRAYTHFDNGISYVYPDRYLRIWKVSTGELQCSSHVGDGLAIRLQISPNNMLFAIQSDANRIEIRKLRTGEVQQTLEIDDNCTDLTFSPDGRRLAILFQSGRADIWDLMTDKCHVINSHGKKFAASAISSDNMRFLSKSYDGKIEIWNVRTGEKLQNFDNNWNASRFAFHSNPAYLATDRGLVCLKAHSNDAVSGHECCRSIVFYNDHWITRGNKNIIWLPPEYQRVGSDSWESILALHSTLGIVSIFEFVDHSNETANESSQE